MLAPLCPEHTLPMHRSGEIVIGARTIQNLARNEIRALEPATLVYFLCVREQPNHLGRSCGNSVGVFA